MVTLVAQTGVVCDHRGKLFSGNVIFGECFLRGMWSSGHKIVEFQNRRVLKAFFRLYYATEKTII